MPGRSTSYPYLLFQVSSILLVAVLPFSRALLSLCEATMFLSALSELILNRTKVSFKNSGFYLLLILVAACLLDGLRAVDANEWIKLTEIKIPLVILPFSILVFQKRTDSRHISLLFLTFLLSISLCTILSMLNYFMDYEAINELVLQSKNVPIIGGMHHITYSVFCALSVFIALYGLWNKRSKWLWIPLLINFAGLHILSARTGLAGMYVAFAVTGFIYILRHRIGLNVWGPALLALILLPLAAYFFVGSFHNRVLNSYQDLSYILNNRDANYKSMAMRVEAGKTAVRIIQQHPVTGVGGSNVRVAMDRQYEADESSLFQENRILPHNQFIMEAVAHGLPGAVILAMFFILPLMHRDSRNNYLFLAFWTLLLFGCMFENLLERQHGILLIAFFWYIIRSDIGSKEQDIKFTKPL